MTDWLAGVEVTNEFYKPELLRILTHASKTNQSLVLESSMIFSCLYVGSPLCSNGHCPISLLASAWEFHLA